MFGEEVRTQPLGNRDMNICDRAKGDNGRRHLPRPFSWCFARHALPGLKYVLTNNGYIVLP